MSAFDDLEELRRQVLADLDRQGATPRWTDSEQVRRAFLWLARVMWAVVEVSPPGRFLPVNHWQMPESEAIARARPYELGALLFDDGTIVPARRWRRDGRIELEKRTP